MSEIVPQLQDITTLAREWISKKFPYWKLTDYGLKQFKPSFDLSRDENVLFLSGHLEMSGVSYAQLEKIIQQVDDMCWLVVQRIEGPLPTEIIDIKIDIQLAYYVPDDAILDFVECAEKAPAALEEFC